jgi:hypothetical protein
MAERILGETGSKRRWRFRFVFLPILLCTALALMLAGGAQAVHDDGFQLDGDVSAACPAGNAFCTSSQKDWANMFTVTATATTETVANSSVVSASGPFTNATFTRDFESGSGCTLNSASTTYCTADNSTFATGSKDTLDIANGGWQCNHDNNVNSKIDIMNAYSTAYTAAPRVGQTVGDKILYFGLEKNKDNGTNDAGFWFLQGDADCSAPSGHKNFTGSNHTVGDVLVVAEYSTGGGVGNISAYRWVGGSNPLTQIATATGSAGDCKTALAADPICATTNSGAKQFSGNIATPWLTSDATLGVGHTVVPPNFFEGGINLTKVFNQSGTTAPSCFNTFIADTRSSTSLTATLFDFTRGTFGQCNTTLSTNAGLSTPPITGEQAPPASIGTGTVQSGTDTATLNITGTSTWGGTLTWYLCGPIASPALCDNHGVSITSRAVSNTSPGSDFISGQANLTSAGRYCWHAHFEPNPASKTAGVKVGDDNGDNECFTVAPVTPTLTTSASCGTSNPCVLGVDTISDTATLSGTATQPGTNGAGGDTGLYKSINATSPAAAGGTISWTLYGPGGTPAGCSNTKATLPASVPVSGDNTYGPTSYTPVLADGVGTYTFVATYGGNGTNTNAPATTATCASPGANEQVTLTGSASSSSAQRYLPNDRIVLSTTGGTTLTGTLTVALHHSSDCSGAVVTGQSYTFTPSGDASGTAYNTTNSTFFVGTKADGTAGGATGDYSWSVHYVDANLTNPADRCESSNVTITD